MECQYSENEFQKKKKPMKNSKLKMVSKSLIWETFAKKKTFSLTNTKSFRRATNHAQQRDFGENSPKRKIRGSIWPNFIFYI